MVTLQELSDRLEIQDLITAYSYAVDFRQFEDLDDIFSADGELDLTATGGIAGPLSEVKQWLGTVLPNFAAHQHLVATSQVVVDADTATARSICHNPMVLDADGKQSLLVVGLWYLDEFVRTEAGWRIRKRSQQKAFMQHFG
jgi:hypothetical protein